MKSSNLIKEDRIGFLIFHMFVIAFVLFLKSVVTFPNDALEMKFLEYLLMGVYIYTFFTAKIYLEWLNSYMIFLYTLFLFNFTRIFLDIVNYKEFGWATKFANFYFYYEHILFSMLHEMIQYRHCHKGCLFCYKKSLFFLQHKIHGTL